MSKCQLAPFDADRCRLTLAPTRLRPKSRLRGAMRKVSLMMLLAVVSNIALAGWVEVGGNETATTFADPVTIRKDGNMVEMWHLVDYAKARGIEGIRPYMSMKARDEYDCKQERTRTLSFSLHSENMGKGETVGTSSNPGNWRPVPRDTLVETLREFACGKQ